MRLDYLGQLKSPRTLRWRRLTLGVDPVCIQIRQGSLVARMLNGFRRLLVDDATRPSPSASLGLHRVGVRGQPTGTSVDLRRKGDGPGDE